MVNVVKCFLAIHLISSVGVISRYGNQNEQNCKIYKHGRVSKSYRVRISYIVRGEALSQQLPPSKWQLGKAQRLCCGSFSFCISVIAQNFSLQIAPTLTRIIAWCPGLTHICHQNVTSVYLGVSNRCPQYTTLSGGPHDIHIRWVAFVLPILNPIHE